MMDVSVSLMHQYTMIVNRMAAPPSTLNASSIQDEQQTSSPPLPTNEVLSLVNDIPSENNMNATDCDSEAGPSTSQRTSSTEIFEVDGNIVKVEDDTSDTQSELRRRRLQRFDNKTEDS